MVTRLISPLIAKPRSGSPAADVFLALEALSQTRRRLLSSPGGGPRRESARSACGESRATDEGTTPAFGFGLSRGVPARRQEGRSARDLGPWHLKRDRGRICPVDFADAAARNEEVFRSINERIEEGAKQHGVEQALPFHCECATDDCVETIELPPAEYDRIASHIARFVVVPGHERTGVEAVIERHPGYFVVEKTGEARDEIEREHPRPRHST